jgi:hypothetical protein
MLPFTVSISSDQSGALARNGGNEPDNGCKERKMTSYLRAACIGYLATAGVVAGLSAPSALTADQAQVLEAAREYALGYTDKLPNFICLQSTSRLSFSQKLPANIQSRSGAPAVLPQLGDSGSNDRIVERLTYFNRTENYEVVSIDGKPSPQADHMQLHGVFSTG